MDDIYKIIEEYNPNKKWRHGKMIADMLSNKKLNPIVTELFITGRKLNISHFLTHNLIWLFQKNMRLNRTHYFVMKILNKRELQQIAFNHSSDIDFEDFMNLYKKCTAKPYSFLAIDTTFANMNFLRISYI